ncbi:MAG: hypothetical protein ABIX37_05190 [Gammaproteobacteria bacterium]
MNHRQATLLLRAASRLAATLGACLLPMAPAVAYWELTPLLDAGITYESNPRYISDESKAILIGANPDITDDVLGTFVDAKLEGVYKTPSSQIALSPRIRKTDYLKSNKDLNDNDWYVDFLAAHNGTLGNVSLNADYRETGVRTSEFESATPSNPDDPLPVSGGSGRFSDDTQSTWEVGPALSFQLSPRNQVRVSGNFAETTYNQEDSPLLASRDYLDYRYSSVDVVLGHTLDEKNAFEIALNGGTFLASEDGRLFENSTDSFGITGTYQRVFSPTLTGSASAGVSRNSIDVSGIIGGFDPLTGSPCLPSGPCAISNEERNFVGSLDLRKRSEETTLNFSLSSQIAPRSDGTEVVQEQARLFVVRTLTRRLTGTFGGIYSLESAVGQIFQPETATFGLARQDRNYFTVDTGLSWQLTTTLALYGTYSYTDNETDTTSGTVSQTNNRLFFGVRYRGVALRR